MPANRTPGLDILALAEDVAAGRRALDNVIDQIAMATPDDRERRRAVAEVQSFVLALAGVRAHAQATIASAAWPQDRSPARDLVVEPRRVTARPSRSGLGGAFAAGASAVAAIIVIAVVVGSLRPAPLAGGPSPSALAGSGGLVSASPAPSSEPSFNNGPIKLPLPPPPTASPTPLPSSVAGASGIPDIPSWPLAGPGLAFSSLIAPDQLNIWFWDPLRVRMTLRVTIATWPGAAINRTVLVSPDGTHVAIHEVDSATNAPVQRVRILTLFGTVVWTAPTLPLVTAMAWSPDGTALAIGSLPVPWTVVQLNLGAAPDVTTYNLDNQDGYALLGFSRDGNTLFGYGTGGEAEFWQKPIAVDRARGTLSHLDAFPGGAAGIGVSNVTLPVDGINPTSGDVLARIGDAKGAPHWVIRHGASEQLLPIDTDMALFWSSPEEFTAIGPAPGQGGRVAVFVGSATQPLTPVAILPDGIPGTRLVGVRDGLALLLLDLATAPSAEFAATEAVLVELATGRTAVVRLPSRLPGAGFAFAGWVSSPA